MKTAAIQSNTPTIKPERPARFLRWPEVQERTGLCRSHVHDMARRGNFPSPIKLGGRASGWLESEIEAWIEERTANAREATQGREARRA